MIRFKLTDPKTMSFGQLTDIDNTVYSATEIRIHTPGEHTIKGDNFEMEI
jgi:carbonic anhydrase